jgi:hypothetical protein
MAKLKYAFHNPEEIQRPFTPNMRFLYKSEIIDPDNDDSDEALSSYAPLLYDLGMWDSSQSKWTFGHRGTNRARTYCTRLTPEELQAMRNYGINRIERNHGQV